MILKSTEEMLVKKSADANRLSPPGQLQMLDENGWALNGLTDKHRTRKNKRYGHGCQAE